MGSSVTWVCFDCRLAARRASTERTRPRCRECGEPKQCIGQKTPLPKKRDAREWDAFQDWFFRERRQFSDYLSKRRTQLSHKLERQIQDLKERAPSKDRDLERKRLSEYLEIVRAWSLENSFGHWHLRRPDHEEHLAARKAFWIARLERQLRQSESTSLGVSPWNRGRHHILKRLEEVRNWSPEFSLGPFG